MDLIDLAAVVVVINSGVGLIALSTGKPVICCGEAYYAHSGLAKAVSNKEELVTAVNNAVLPNEEKRLRFFRYLIEEFYSFGEPRYNVKIKSGDKIRSVRRIVFSSIRGLGRPVELGKPPRQFSSKAPLYFSFGGKEALLDETASVKKLIELGSTSFATGDHNKAFHFFEVANRRKPNNRDLSRVVAEIAVAAYQAGHHNDTIRLLAQARSWNPNDKGLLRSLIDIGKAARAAGRYSEAVQLLELAHDWAPEDKKLYRILLESGVQRHGGPLVELMIASISGLKERARQAFTNADLREAALLFHTLHLREPKKTEYLRCLAECYLHFDGNEKAEQCLEEALSLEPGNKSIQRRLKYIRLPWWKRLFNRNKPFDVRKKG